MGICEVVLKKPGNKCISTYAVDYTLPYFGQFFFKIKAL